MEPRAAQILRRRSASVQEDGAYWWRHQRVLAAGPAAGSLRRDHGQFRAEVVEMQEGHGPSDRPEPEGDRGTSPGASWVPWAEPTPEPSDQPSQPGPGQPSQPSYGQPGYSHAGHGQPSPPGPG